MLLATSLTPCLPPCSPPRYSAHRGRLWIAATAKEVNPEEVAALEEFYTEYHGGPLNFPAEYPSACLLGCVDVHDVLGQEDYAEQFPDGESSSPNVFVCENPQELVVKFSVKGQHKIWRLERQMLDAAKGAIEPVDPGNVRDEASFATESCG